MVTADEINAGGVVDSVGGALVSELDEGSWELDEDGDE